MLLTARFSAVEPIPPAGMVPPAFWLFHNYAYGLVCTLSQVTRAIAAGDTPCELKVPRPAVKIIFVPDLYCHTTMQREGHTTAKKFTNKRKRKKHSRAQQAKGVL